MSIGFRIASDTAKSSVKAFRFIPDNAVHLYQFLVTVAKDSCFGCQLKKQAG